MTRFNDLLREHGIECEHTLSKGISFNDLDEIHGNRSGNSLKDAFDELKVCRMHKSSYEYEQE